MSAAAGAESFTSVQGFMSSGFGILILFGWTFALFFHLCHGVRHLIWDAGQSFEKEKMDNYAMIEVGISAALTFFLWALA
jgi:succinate dehydrogenase / fumarate reductase cytochrome b subunit